MNTRQRPPFKSVLGRAVLCLITGAWSATISSSFNFMTGVAIYFFVFTVITLWRWWGPGVFPAVLLPDAENTARPHDQETPPSQSDRA